MATFSRNFAWFSVLFLAILNSCTSLREASVQRPSEVAKPAVTVTKDPALREKLERLATALEAKRNELHIPGMALAVVKDDALIYARGFGFANLEQQTPVAPDTLFAVGSTTKAFTSALIGMLAEEGKMDWDDPVTKHLAYLQLPIDSQNDDDSVTIRDLLSHRTGFSRMSLLWVNGTATPENILQDAVHAEPWSPFRENFFYNNVMYLAAGMASAQAAGSDWGDLLQKRLFEPLAMEDSTISFAKVQQDPRLALGYRYEEATGNYAHLPMRNLENIAPAGAINSNVLDMAQWVRLQLSKGVFAGERLLSEAQVAEMRKPNIAIADGVDYGMGWMLHEWEGQPVVQHGGNIDGFCAMAALLPESNLGFVLLSNVTATPLQQLSINMVWDHLAKAPEDVDQIAASETVDPSLSFEPYLGEYLANFGPFKDAIMTVLEKNGKLAVDVPGQTVYELKPPGEDGKWYFVLTDTIAVSFERNEKDQVKTMRMHQAGFDFELPRKGIPILPETDERQFVKYLGKYHSDMLQGEVTALIQNHRLAVDFAGRITFELHLPDENGRRGFRIRKGRSVVFNEAEDGSIASITFYHGEEVREVMPRTSTEVSKLLTEAEIHTLRDSDRRAKTLKAHGGLRMTGTVRQAQAGVTGKSTFWMMGSQNYRQDLDFGKYGNTKVAVAGDRGASDQSFAQFEMLGGIQLEQTQKANPAMIFGDWRAFYEKTDVMRDASFKEADVHVVQLSGGEANPTQLFIDPVTGDVLKQETVMTLPDGMGAIPIVNEFEDYRDVEGLRIPFRIITSNDQSGKTVFQFDDIETNLKLDDAVFILEKPESR